MMRAVTVLTLALLVAAATVPAFAQSLDDVVREIESVYGRMTDLRADFTQTAFNAEFQDFITRYAFGEIWTRAHFDERTRRVLVIGTVLALGKWDEFRLHMRAAITEGGFSADDVKEIILQQMIYCGVPAANHAFREAAAVLKDLGKTG